MVFQDRRSLVTVVSQDRFHWYVYRCQVYVSPTWLSLFELCSRPQGKWSVLVHSVVFCNQLSLQVEDKESYMESWPLLPPPPLSLSLWLTLPYIRFHGDFLTVPTPCKLLLPIPTPPPLSPNSLPSSSCRFQLLLIDGVVVLWGIGSVPVINTCYADLFLRGAAYWFVGKLLQRWVGVGVCGRVTTQVASESSHGQPLDSPSQSQTTRSPRVHNNFSFNCGWLFACFSHLYWISKLQNVFWCMSRYTHWTPSVNYHTI